MPSEAPERYTPNPCFLIRGIAHSSRVRVISPRVRDAPRPGRASVVPTLTEALGRSEAFSQGAGVHAAATAIFPLVPANDENPGVLGNLPRSRPGQRSAKRS